MAHTHSLPVKIQQWRKGRRRGRTEESTVDGPSCDTPKSALFPAVGRTGAADRTLLLYGGDTYRGTYVLLSACWPRADLTAHESFAFTCRCHTALPCPVAFQGHPSGCDERRRRVSPCRLALRASAVFACGWPGEEGEKTLTSSELGGVQGTHTWVAGVQRIAVQVSCRPGILERGKSRTRSSWPYLCQSARSDWRLGEGSHPIYTRLPTHTQTGCTSRALVWMMKDGGVVAHLILEGIEVRYSGT